MILLALACATCHPAIVAAYEASPMARSSGHVTSLPPGAYRHPPSQTTYTIEPPNRVRIRTPLETATQTLEYFLGSGAHGRSYLFRRGDKLFQAPVTHYAHRGWGMSPGYETDDHSDWTRPIGRDCLWCHASSAQPIYGTANQYADPPFRENGITCERCHGDARAHTQNPTIRPVNPAKLPRLFRDDVCRQCHLLGLNRINKPGRSFYSYRPGTRLDVLVTYQTAPQHQQDDLKTTGHFERLAMSKCQIVSQEKLWCGTCHNPHPTTARQDPNQPCRTCHANKLSHGGPDCQNCHMPKAATPEAGHSMFTDHWIR